CLRFQYQIGACCKLQKPFQIELSFAKIDAAAYQLLGQCLLIGISDWHIRPQLMRKIIHRHKNASMVETERPLSHIRGCPMRRYNPKAAWSRCLSADNIIPGDAHSSRAMLHRMIRRRSCNLINRRGTYWAILRSYYAGSVRLDYRNCPACAIPCNSQGE